MLESIDSIDSIDSDRFGSVSIDRSTREERAGVTARVLRARREWERARVHDDPKSRDRRSPPFFPLESDRRTRVSQNVRVSVLRRVRTLPARRIPPCYACD